MPVAAIAATNSSLDRRFLVDDEEDEDGGGSGNSMDDATKAPGVVAALVEITLAAT
jgi:hypothetical protein